MKRVVTVTPIAMLLVVISQAAYFGLRPDFALDWLVAICWSLHVGRFLRRRAAGLDAQIFVVVISNATSDDHEILAVETLAVWLVPVLAILSIVLPWLR